METGDVVCERGNIVLYDTISRNLSSCWSVYGKPSWSFFLAVEKHLQTVDKISLANVWNQVLLEYVEQNIFYKEEFQNFKQFGELLGQQQRQQEVNNIELYMEQIEHKLEELYKELPQKKKVTQTVILALGGMVSIVVI